MEPKHHAQDIQRKSSTRNGNDQIRPSSCLSRVASDVFAMAESSHVNSRCARKLENLGRTIDTVGRVIDGKKFEASLDRFLPRPLKDGTPVRKRLRDAQFRQLGEFCTRAGYPQWGLRPRTFAVLRMIGCPETIDKFIEERLTDIFLPYSEDNLPNFISGEARWHFLDCQNYVLSGRAAALERPGEPHQNVEGSADDYFMYVEDLGAGGFGEVDSVIGEMSLMKFARKRIKRHRLSSRDKARLQIFENELQTLKSLSHRHLVQLIGSYTDSSCVGLIMTPVADMNLATYLKETKNQESRKICLRRFFGCLATALSYLHDQHVQHKDIKPANILVKEQKVYLTDFGTSRSWDNETSKTTQGTVHTFTPRYCAPEVVQFGSSRNESRDIWSLGCVYFEMCSVLADHTVEEMSQFFKENGTGGEYIRENNAGATAWAKRLRSDFAMPQDRRPLELALRMCTIEPRKRPLAKELVTMIFDFDGSTRYYGICCDEQCYSKEHSSDQTPDVAVPPEEIGLTNDTQGTKEIQEVNTIWSPGSRYRSPTVDDPTENLTLQAFFSPGGIAKKYILEDAEEPDESIEVATFQKDLTHPAPQVPDAQPLSQPAIAGSLIGRTLSADILHSPLHGNFTDNLPHSKTTLFILRSLDPSQLPCPWPTCSQQLRFYDGESLVTHLREVHGTHELFWTPLLHITSIVATTQSPDQRMLGQVVPVAEPSSTDKAYIWKRDAASSVTRSDHFTDCLIGQIRKMRRRFLETKVDPVLPRSDPISHQHTIGRDTSEELKDNSVPFSLLPDGRRPEPLKSTLKEYEASDEEEEQAIVSPELIPEPFISSDPKRNNGTLESSIPRSSLVPSYFLATANRLSPNIVDSAVGPLPLFVYGSLMFPSVLRAQAARFISAEGIYCRQLQRRIPTSAEDWSSVNESLQQAAQQMTPALLKGYRRFETQRSQDAALINAKRAHFVDFFDKTRSQAILNTKNNVMGLETQGFVVFGLSYEAFACLDYLYGFEGQKPQSTIRHNRNSDSDTASDTDSNSDSDLSNINVYYRKKVQVTIYASDGKPRSVEAFTYMWYDGPRLPFKLWDLNKFVRGESFRQFSTSAANYVYDWVGEERVLANKMGMKYAMRGDELCDKILNNDVDGINHLVAEGCDINAPCHHYGTPLQAAAAKGNEKMVYVMMRFLNADPDIVGGKYQCPLVAAISEGHQDVVQTLLKYGANPLTGAGSYISPVYQAVSFEDVEMTRLLLEKGAWLSKDYQELLDLAAETGKDDLRDVLKEYDIRNLHQSKRLVKGDRRSRRHDSMSHSDEQGLTDRKPNRVMLALFEIWQLKGQKGKWTGVKAIKVLRTAYANDVPDGLLDFLSNHLKDIQGILTGLIQGAAQIESRIEQGKKPRYANTIEDAVSSDDNATALSTPSPRQFPQHSPTIQKTHYGRAHDADDDAFCLPCGGTGGRKGTGRHCFACRGSGSIERSAKANDPGRRQFKKCRACNGIGNVFSERDRCRLCNKGGWRRKEQLARGCGAEYVKRETEAELGSRSKRRLPLDESKSRREYWDPPPPYPGR